MIIDDLFRLRPIMRHLLRPANLYLLLTYMACRRCRSCPLLLGKPVARPWQVLGIELLAWLAAWAIFKRPACFHWLLLPAFLALPTEIYLYTYYGQGISTHHLGIIAETSPMEAMEFLGSKVWLMLAVLVGACRLVVRHAARGALRTRDLDWNDSSRWVALAALVAGARASGRYGHEFGIAARQPGSEARAAAAGAPGQGKGRAGGRSRQPVAGAATRA